MGCWPMCIVGVQKGILGLRVPGRLRCLLSLAHVDVRLGVGYGRSIDVSDQKYRWVWGKKEVEVEFGTERERVEALEKEFGILLDEQERRGIVGMASSIG